MIKQSEIDAIIRDLYGEIVAYQDEKEPYEYDDQTQRSHQTELCILNAKISVCRNVIKRLQAIGKGG